MSSSYYLFKCNSFIITTIILVLLSLLWLLLLQFLFWLILLVQLFLRNQVAESSKQGIQAAWSTPIHYVKWWISCFWGIYRVLEASEAGLFLILLRGLLPLCNVTRSSVLAAVGVLYLPLYFTFIVIFIVVIIIYIALLILLLLSISFLLFQLLLEFFSRAVYCFYEVSWPFDFVSFNFIINLNLIHTTTIWCWCIWYYHLASFNYGDMKARDTGWIVDVIWTILCLIVSLVIIGRWGKV